MPSVNFLYFLSQVLFVYRCGMRGCKREQAKDCGCLQASLMDTTIALCACCFTGTCRQTLYQKLRTAKHSPDSSTLMCAKQRRPTWSVKPASQLCQLTLVSSPSSAVCLTQNAASRLNINRFSGTDMLAGSGILAELWREAARCEAVPHHRAPQQRCADGPSGGAANYKRQQWRLMSDALVARALTSADP
jgi:hypothetical protein